MSEELKPCPFCGGSAAPATVKYTERMVAEQEWDQSTFHYCNCVKCSTQNLGMVGFKTPEEAAHHWNTRAGITDARRSLEHLLIGIEGEVDIDARSHLFRRCVDEARETLAALGGNHE